MKEYKCKILLHVEIDVITTLPFNKAKQLIKESTKIRKIKKVSNELSITDSRLVDLHRTY